MAERLNQTQFALTYSEFLDLRLKSLNSYIRNHDVKGMAEVDGATSFIIDAMFNRLKVEYIYNLRSQLLTARTSEDFSSFRVTEPPEYLIEK